MPQRDLQQLSGMGLRLSPRSASGSLEYARFVASDRS
jgi:hypothetical protein